MRFAALTTALLCAASMQGQAQPRVPEPQASDAGTDRHPLSNEDQELLKDLALLERLELLRNLELFDDRNPPDAGQR
jgi:hypothetical protein